MELLSTIPNLTPIILASRMKINVRYMIFGTWRNTATNHCAMVYIYDRPALEEEDIPSGYVHRKYPGMYCIFIADPERPGTFTPSLLYNTIIY